MVHIPTLISSKVFETIHNFQILSLGLLSELGRGIRKISDCASVEQCKRIFNKVVVEVLNLALLVTSEVLQH